MGATACKGRYGCGNAYLMSIHFVRKLFIFNRVTHYHIKSYLLKKHVRITDTEDRKWNGSLTRQSLELRYTLRSSALRSVQKAEVIHETSTGYTPGLLETAPQLKLLPFFNGKSDCPLVFVYTEETDSPSVAPQFCIGKGLTLEAPSRDMRCHLIFTQWLSGSGLGGGGKRRKRTKGGKTGLSPFTLKTDSKKIISFRRK